MRGNGAKREDRPSYSRPPYSRDTERAARGDARAARDDAPSGERIAKRLARIGVASRRDAERMIEGGRIAVNGRTLDTPATLVTNADRITLDGEVLPAPERTRLWLMHKPAGLVTTAHDPEGRPTVFDALPGDMPRAISVGRLDINTEGLLLLTNDGGLARVLELPSTGWLRRYRVRAHGRVRQAELDELRHGMAVDGVFYGAIEAELEREQGSNMWLTLGLREGKNREVKNVLGALGLEVNRLIRVSYGPFQLGELEPGAVREIRGRALRDQLGSRLIEAAGADFDADIRSRALPAGGGAVRDDKGERDGRGEREGRGGGERDERENEDTRRPVRKRGDWVTGSSPFQRPKRDHKGDKGNRDDRGADPHGPRERGAKRKVWDEEGRPYRIGEDDGSNGRRFSERRTDDRGPKKHMWRAPDATPGRSSSGLPDTGGNERRDGERQSRFDGSRPRDDRKRDGRKGTDDWKRGDGPKGRGAKHGKRPERKASARRMDGPKPASKRFEDRSRDGSKPGGTRAKPDGARGPGKPGSGRPSRPEGRLGSRGAPPRRPRGDR